MTGRVSGNTERAIKSFRAGMNIYAHAKAHKIAPSTLYRALKRLKVNGERK